MLIYAYLRFLYLLFLYFPGVTRCLLSNGVQFVNIEVHRECMGMDIVFVMIIMTDGSCTLYGLMVIKYVNEVSKYA